MAGRYDKDYQNVVEQLKEAFLKDEKENEAIVGKRAQIKEIPEDEHKLIRSKLSQDVQEISYLDEKEKMLLQDIHDYMKRNYKVAIWKMTGVVNMKEIMSAYTKLIQDNETFRTVYLYKGLKEPVRVVYEKKEQLTFPVHDLRNMSQDRSSLVIRSAMAAESRCEYNMETDALFRIRGYLTKFDELIVVVSVYPHLPSPIGMREMLHRIFPGMKSEASNIQTVNENTLRKMYEQLQNKSVEYWQGLLAEPDQVLTLPGEKTAIQGTNRQYGERAVLYRELGEELTNQVNKFAEENHISDKTVFLYAWAQLAGKYHNEEHPILATAYYGEHLQILPVRIDRTMPKAQALEALETQYAHSAQYVNCTVEDIERATGLSFAEHFRMLHGFEDMGEKPQEAYYADDGGINLCISYQHKDKGMVMNYVSRSGILEIMLDNIHELFLENLLGVIQADNARFDKKTYIRMDDTDEEKLHKLRAAQIALYLKNTGIFDTLTVEGIMELAESCTLRTYLESDTVMAEGSRQDMICIIGDGRLEESRMDMEGMVKSLRIARPGSVIGIESLFEGATLHSTYTVVGPKAGIVEIDREIFKEVLRRKPEGWIRLLELENDQKCKMQRLWTME